MAHPGESAEDYNYNAKLKYSNNLVVGRLKSLHISFKLVGIRLSPMGHYFNSVLILVCRGVAAHKMLYVDSILHPWRSVCYLSPAGTGFHFGIHKFLSGDIRLIYCSFAYKSLITMRPPTFIILSLTKLFKSMPFEVSNFNLVTIPGRVSHE